MKCPCPYSFEKMVHCHATSEATSMFDLRIRSDSGQRFTKRYRGSGHRDIAS